MSIKSKQLNILNKAKLLFQQYDINQPNLTGLIWNMINDENQQSIINSSETNEFSENWSNDLVGQLQRILVNYQLHQLKIGNGPKVFILINEIFNNIKGDNLTLIDIGCTTGYYYEILNFFFENKFKYFGCDYNEASIKLAKQYYPNIEFDVEDITKLSYSDKQFDISFLSGVIEHVPDYEKGIQELCRITKKYIVLHRIYLTDNQTVCKKGTQYLVPVIRYTYNYIDFFSLLNKNNFRIKWQSSGYFDNNCKSYILERI